MQCPKFIDMDSFQRNNIVVKLQICKNCLFSHGNVECKSTKPCKECNKKHHTLLHNSKPYFNLNQRPSTSTQQPQHSSNHLSSNDIEVLLTTIQLNIQTYDGTYVTLRALLDGGSQINLISENAAQLLGLPRQKLNATISGAGAISGDCKGRLQLQCKSIHSNYTFNTDVLIMKELTNNYLIQHSREVTGRIWKILNSLTRNIIYLDLSIYSLERRSTLILFWMESWEALKVHLLHNKRI